MDAGKCEFMNGCSGHGECKNGRCECAKGYYTGDCSVKAQTLTAEAKVDVKLGPKGWGFYAYEGSEVQEIHLKNDFYPLEVYYKRGLDEVPSVYDYDLLFRGKEVAVMADSAPFTLAVFNPMRMEDMREQYKATLVY